MNVRELIEELQTYDPNLPVETTGYGSITPCEIDRDALGVTTWTHDDNGKRRREPRVVLLIDT